MDAQKRLDKILIAAHDRVQEEVSALIGAEVKFSASGSILTTKAQFFDTLTGKQVFAKVDLTGDIVDVGGISIGIRGAIRLGGTLIMLPPAELEEVAGREEYSEEIDDSYGEIANIIAGSYTKTFEDMHKKNFRFVRKELEILQPQKVEAQSDEPLPEQTYYQVGSILTMGSTELGELFFLMPAAPFGLVAETEPPKAQEAAVAQQAAPEEPAAREPIAVSDDAAEPVAAVERKTFDFDKQKRTIDKILASCQEKLSEEVSALIGSPVKFADHKATIISKEDFFFDELDGKQAQALLDVTGETTGAGYLYINLKSAIHFGGSLIMLPPSELEISVNDEDFSIDINDAYGEIANIMTGAISLAFEEQYPEQIHIVRKEVEAITPMKVETDSDEPMPDGKYYMSSMAVSAKDKELGRLRLLFPIGVLHLEQIGTDQAATGGVAPSAGTAQPAAAAGAASSQVAGPEPDAAAMQFNVDPDFDLAKHHRKVEKVLEECRQRMQSEVGELLGAEVSLKGLGNRLVNKEAFFFEEVSGKQVMANMEVVGDEEGSSYLFVSLKDAIYTGGTLIMLPTSELDNVVAEETFNDDTSDAFGEIANIIAGVYTAVFEEQYSGNLRFIKKELAQVIPMKVEPESDEPIPDQLYFMSGMTLAIGGVEKGKVHMLFPAQMLHLDMLGREDELARAQAAAKQARAGGGTAAGQVVSAAAGATAFSPADILIISEDEGAAGVVMTVAQAKGFTVRKISYSDDIRRALTAELRAVYLVMGQVTEQAFGIAINVRGASTLPLIAAGPAWTRSKVIKAVKYGISDILLTPAGDEDVAENIENNLARKAA